MGLLMLNISPYRPIVVPCSTAFRRLQDSCSGSSDDFHVSLDLFDHRIEPSAQHLLGETESEPLDGVEWRMGRHGKSKWIYNRIDNDGTILVRESFSQTCSNVLGFLDANPFRAHGLSNLGKIWILELHARRNEAGLLLFDVDEVVPLVVENDLNHRSSPFYLRQQIAHSKHREASIAAQRDALSAGICQSTSERIRCSIGHRRPRERAKEPAVFSTI